MNTRQRHVPLRRCVSCGTQFPHRELVRIVRAPDGTVTVDTDRKKQAGRGAYLCHAPACWEQGLKRSRLDYALRGRISPEEREQLQKFARTELAKL